MTVAETAAPIQRFPWIVGVEVREGISRQLRGCFCAPSNLADLGAGEWVTFRRVTLPHIVPGVVGGALLAFIVSTDDLVITCFIAGVDSTTLPVFIHGMLRRGVKPEINAIATLMLMFTFIVASLGLYLRRRS